MRREMMALLFALGIIIMTYGVLMYLEYMYEPSKSNSDIQKELLDSILDNITTSNMTDEQKVIAVHAWVNNTIKHDKVPLQGDQNFNITAIMQVKDTDCGGHSMMVLSLLLRSNISARMIETPTHVVVEVYYNDMWHVVDADPMPYGGTIYNQSACEMYDNFKVGIVYPDNGFEILERDEVCE